MLRRLVPVAALALLVGGCGTGSAPEVTFAVGADSVVAAPTQYCEDDFVTCRNDPAAPVSLAVPVGTALQVTVPREIADTPWQIVYTYRDAAGEQVDGRTEVLTPQLRDSYTLELPAAGARLITAQVQQYGPPPQINDDTGELEFLTRSSWVFVAG